MSLCIVHANSIHAFMCVGLFIYIGHTRFKGFGRTVNVQLTHFFTYIFLRSIIVSSDELFSTSK